MPKLEIKIPYNLTQSEALTRIQQFLPGLKAQYSDKISNLEETWSGKIGEFKFKISGFKVSGRVTVEVTYVLINGNIPWMAVPFKGQIESTIRQQAEALLK